MVNPWTISYFSYSINTTGSHIHQQHIHSDPQIIHGRVRLTRTKVRWARRGCPQWGLWRAKEDDPGQPCAVENSVCSWTVAPVSEYIYSANPRDHVLHGNWLNLDHIVYYIFGLKLDANTWTPTSTCTWLWLVPKEIRPRDMQAPTTSCSKQNNQD